MNTGQTLFFGIPIILLLIVLWIWGAFKLTFKVYADKHIGRGDNFAPFIATVIIILFLWLELAIPYALYMLYNYYFNH